MSVSILSEQEYHALERAMESVSGKRKREAIVAWAERLEIEYGMLQAALAGQVEIVDYDSKSGGAKVRISKSGERRVEKLIADAKATV